MPGFSFVFRHESTSEFFKPIINHFNHKYNLVQGTFVGNTHRTSMSVCIPMLTSLVGAPGASVTTVDTIVSSHNYPAHRNTGQWTLSALLWCQRMWLVTIKHLHKDNVIHFLKGCSIKWLLYSTLKAKNTTKSIKTIQRVK